jgi:hypothetical protein
LSTLRGESQPQHEVEELRRVFERQAAPVVQIRRAVLYPSQREGLNGAVARLVFEEPLQAEVMHPVIKVEGRRVAASALTFAEEDLLAAQFAFGSLYR